ncbi:Putative major facilitator superfamily, MFS transporter superfamily [Septoria linicola]|uniref:Major facilitator superfamily, MFS transporter superfamily n=1 Tax=Septoria linicola TaxID=215465 RepID=A0A9Q9ADY0_9PEZI|nr:Putative major facilitator superfamily, MFS transporter superfamily [Septoria linicola]
MTTTTSSDVASEKQAADSGSDNGPGSVLNDDVEHNAQLDNDKNAYPSTTPSAPVQESTTIKPPPPGPPGGPVPNGGTQAWIQVLCSWMLFFNTWGVLNTYGVYQTYYESGQLFTESSSNISWIGSIQSFMVLLVGAFIGPIYDRGHLRPLLIVGAFLIVFGHMMLSLCTEYWQCLLAQGFVVGIGGGCLFVPSVAILPTYFSTHIGLSMGVAASGSSMGGIIYPIMFYRLINHDNLGFAWSVRVLGFTALATLLVPICLMHQRVKPAKPRSLIDWTAFRDVPYLTFVLGCMIGFIGLYVGFFYISFYGSQRGYTNESLSFYLVPILNAGSVFGRTLPNVLADRIGPANVIVPGSLCVGIVLLCLMAVTNTGGMIVVTLLFGFFSGIFIALPPVLFVALTEDKSKVGTRIGMGFAVIGLGVLAGGPGGGGILGTSGSGADLASEDLNWNGNWIYAGVAVLVGSAIFTVVRVMKGGSRLMVRV